MTRPRNKISAGLWFAAAILAVGLITDLARFLLTGTANVESSFLGAWCGFLGFTTGYVYRDTE